MRLIENDDGEMVIDLSGCRASYTWWGSLPLMFDEVEEPTWVTSFCVLEQEHLGQHVDHDGNEFTDGEERGGVG